MRWYFMWLLITSTSFLFASEAETILARFTLPASPWESYPCVETSYDQQCREAALLKIVQSMSSPQYNRTENQHSFTKKNQFLGANSPIDD